MPPRSDWEQRSRAALMLCDQSWTAVSNGSTGDLRQAAQYAVDAWGRRLDEGPRLLRAVRPPSSLILSFTCRNCCSFLSLLIFSLVYSI